jgi:hypothetical protein
LAIVLGTQFHEGSVDVMRRQARAMDALEVLQDAIAVDLQWRDRPPPRPWLRTLAALARDSTTVTGCAGPPKPIATELFDALAAFAQRAGCRYFAFFNADIIVTPEATSRIAGAGKQAYAFSRMDQDADGRDAGVLLPGLDLFAFDVSWWTANRRRFRPYIVGEACWDNVYAAVLMCHADGMIVNRDAEIRHEHHAPPSGRSAFADYNAFLAALDSRYFTLWARYYAALVEARARGASQADEEAIAARTFVWRRSLPSAVWQAGRNVKAFLRFRRQRARWPPAKP